MVLITHSQRPAGSRDGSRCLGDISGLHGDVELVLEHRECMDTPCLRQDDGGRDLVG